MKVKEESQKVDLKLNIQKTKIMASGPITSWEIDGERVETVSDFIFLGSNITVDGDCSHEIKRHLLLRRKFMTNLDSILKVDLANKGPSSQGYILSPCLFNLYAEYIIRNAGLEETKLESRLPGEISITSDMQMIPPLWQKVKKN